MLADRVQPGRAGRSARQSLAFHAFFDQATLNPAASQITGSVCGVKVQEVKDPLMRQIRYLDKLVDELTKGRPMEKVLRALPAEDD